ncbi:hypothetical protein WL29_23450 [Burkholderia ubonensis]|uniref:Uncharacterized protein n=1 Tax=Burkholderia ubonensis TaxID=101571 RepID=A0A125DMG5_9BURK|nr:hypothetical protein [Burkholderia ubonensis]KWA84315.1 hypothetical protein WL29_23450 [Burkholderia ubonensis]
MAFEKLKLTVLRKFVQLDGRRVTAVLHAVRHDDTKDDDRPKNIVVQCHRAAFENESDVLTETAEQLLLLEENTTVIVSVVYERKAQCGPTRHLYRLQELTPAPEKTSAAVKVA